MQLGLSIPFRTLLNLDSELVAVERLQAAVILKDAFSHLASSEMVDSLSIIEPGQGDTKAGLKNLSQDIIPWFARPIATIRLSERFVTDAIAALSHDSEQQISPDSCGLRMQVTVDLFDNTIAVATARCDIDLLTLPSGWGADEFETFLSNVCETLVAPVNNQIVAPILAKLHESKKSLSKGRSLLRPERKFKVFADLNHHPFPNWDDNYSPCFWSHRVYSAVDFECGEAVAQELCRASEIEQFGHRLRDGTIVYVGSSLVKNTQKLDSFLKSLSICQYFYCLLDVLNANQNRIYRKISAVTDRKEAITIIDEFNRMENFIDYIHNEIVDTEISLQGDRQLFFLGISKTFGIEKLVDILRGRDKLVLNRVDRKRFEIERSSRRIIQFSLFVLGAAQIMTLIVELFNFVGASPTGTIVGLSDLIEWLDFNLTFHIISIMIIVGAFYASIRKQ